MAMKFLFVLIDPHVVRVFTEFPELDEGFIYGHLKQYCSHFDPLPAITLKIIDQQPVVVRGHIYLQIAKDLGRLQIRAVIQNGSSENIPGVISIVSKEELEEEVQCQISESWHVFFIDGALSSNDEEKLKKDFSIFLRSTLPELILDDDSPLIGWNYDPSGPYFEALFPTPRVDIDWASKYRKFIYSISDKYGRIISYQGRKWELR